MAFGPVYRAVTKTVHEFVLPIESNIPPTRKDLYALIRATESKISELKGANAVEWDDSFHVGGNDEEIVLYFETERIV